MPIEPKKRRNKQKRSLSKQSSSLSSHGNADARAVDPAHFVTHAEFSPVTPPDTPGTLGSYTLPQSTYKSTVSSSDAKTKSLTQSQTWTVHGPLPGHPSAKTLQHGASGQFAGFVVTPSHGAISQEWANIPVHQLQQIQEAQKAQAKSNSNLAETAATAKSLNSSCGQTELLSSQSQLISSPAQPMLYSIQSLVYKASSSPARTEAVQPTSPSSSRDPALPKKTQTSSDLRTTKFISALPSDTQSSSSPAYVIKKEMPQQIKVTSPPYSVGFASSGFDPALYAHLLGSSFVSSITPSHYRPQGIGAAGFAAPGKTSYAQSCASVSVASLYPHIHSSSQINAQTMLSGKQQLMLSALSMGSQRKPSSVESSIQDTAPRTNSVKSSTSSLQSSHSFSSPKQLSILIPSPQQVSLRQKNEPGIDDKSKTVHSRKPSADSRSHDGCFSPLTPTDIGAREMLTGNISSVQKAGSQCETIVQLPSTTILSSLASSNHSLGSLKTFPYAALVQKTIASPSVADSATDSAPETERDAPLQVGGKLDQNTSFALTTITKSENDTETSTALSMASTKKPTDSLPQNLPTDKTTADSLAAEDEPSSPGDTELVIDEEEKSSDEIRSQQISQTKAFESPRKDTELLSPKSESASEAEDKSGTLSVVSSSVSVISDFEPVTWPKTKKQLARQQLTSKTTGKYRDIASCIFLFEALTCSI